MHKLQHDKRQQLQSSLQDSPSKTAPVTPAMNRWAIFTHPAGVPLAAGLPVPSRSTLHTGGRAASGTPAPVTSAMNKILREDITISPLVLCLPPTLVGGQRPKSLFREPASAGLLEEFKSPAQAGSRAICRPSNHQLKLVANRNICLCVSRFMRTLVNRWAISTRPAGATTIEPRTTRNGEARDDTRINTRRPMTRHAFDDSENDRADLRNAPGRWRVREVFGMGK